MHYAFGHNNMPALPNENQPIQHPSFIPTTNKRWKSSLSKLIIKDLPSGKDLTKMEKTNKK